jgi:hypothetical protein
MIDVEFNIDKRQLTWVDMVSGNLWAASYDYSTGNFIPASGEGTLIEANVSSGGTWGGLGFTVNGPEWALGSPTDYIVYTRTNAPGSPTAANSLIGVAYQNANGAWVTASLATPQRNGPYGSIWRGSGAKISYQDAKGTHYVRALTDAKSEIALPGLTNSGLTPAARFADTGNIVVYQLSYNGIPQSVAYNIDTGVLTQLTFDAGPKDQSWMWSAPEFNGALALMTTVNNSTVALYRPVVGPSGATTYRLYGTAVAPRGGSWFSVEPFAYQGQSYAIMQFTPKGSNIPGSIWLAGFDPAHPLLRQLTPNTVSTDARADAEFVPIATGVMLVYSKFDTTKCPPQGASAWLCAEGLLGLFRAETGLPAPN